MPKWLYNDYILKFLTHNEEKSKVADMYIRISKSKIYKKQLMIVDLTLVV